MRALLLAVLLAAPGAAMEDPHTLACTPDGVRAVEDLLPELMRKRLKALPSKYAKAAAKALARHKDVPVSLAFVEPEYAAEFRRAALPHPDITAVYLLEERRFFLAHYLIHANGGDEKTFVSDPKAREAVADVVAPAFLHETSHLMDGESLPASTTPFLEAELIAFYREALFVSDVVAKNPAFAGHDEALKLQREAFELFRELDAAPEAGASKETLRERLARVDRLEPLYERKASLRHHDLYLLNALARSNEEFERAAVEPYGDRLKPLEDARSRALLADLRKEANRSRARGKLDAYRLDAALVAERYGPENFGRLRASLEYRLDGRPGFIRALEKISK